MRGFYCRIDHREDYISDHKRAGHNMRTVHLTIAGTGGSIVAQSWQEWVGDVAQLVERRNGIAEATGSTPVVSTNLLFGVQGQACKSLAIFAGSTTLTRLRRRNRFPRT